VALQPVPIAALDPHAFASILAADDYARLLDLIARSGEALSGRVIWNVSSTAAGGGVAELLRPLLGYSRGGGVDARWLVIAGTPEFFQVTKRVHNHLHGFAGDGGPLRDRQRRIYEQVLDDSGAELVRLVRSDDIVILHDPQTAGMTAAVHRTGARVIWRCHVGMDHPNQHARAAWDFLRPYLQDADAFVFSRASFEWDGLDPARSAVIQPSIDVFSPKNQDQSRQQSLAILSRARIIPHRTGRHAGFTRADGTPARVDRRAEMVEDAPLAPADSFVVQISRWDRLKDPLGVMRGFSGYVAERCSAHLVLAGPATGSVADDPEGAAVFAEVAGAWEHLSPEVRSRVHLASLPMADIEENAAIVNALQRAADMVVQKSLAEGFGLTVAEAMWKTRPVVASRIGGIQDQIVDGQSGILISDPRNLAEFGSAVADLLNDRRRAEGIGLAARARIREHFLGPHHLQRYFELFEQLIPSTSSRVPDKAKA
jgi:trehalose synthase